MQIIATGQQKGYIRKEKGHEMLPAVPHKRGPDTQAIAQMGVVHAGKHLGSKKANRQAEHNQTAQVCQPVGHVGIPLMKP